VNEFMVEWVKMVWCSDLSLVRPYGGPGTFVNRSVPDAEVAVVGAGVVGSAVALALARRSVSVLLLEAEPQPGLAASGTNSGILHTGFDSPSGELETELILRSAEMREQMLATLDVPVLRCGALLRPPGDADRPAVAALAENARRNGVAASLRDDGALEVPGEAVTDPVRYTLALAAAAERHGAELRTGFEVAALRRVPDGFTLEAADGESARTRLVLNCAGLHADDLARLAGDHSFEIYPRKGEFLVFEPGPERPLVRILLPLPTEGTKGVLVFPTLDGKVVAGPTAVDQEDKSDWSVRPEAVEELLPKAVAMWPPIEEAEQLGVYAGLRPAGRGVNYLIGPSEACDGLVNVAAIRSTGLSASLGIAERVCELVASLGIRLGEERPLEPGPAPQPDGPWWRRTAEHVAA
jgi:glycerol-3-phosphate dehydrogenase